MEIKFTFACEVCKCKMDIGSDHCALPANILCQNCGQPVPDGVYKIAVQVIEAFNALPDCTDSEEGKGFSLSAKVIPPCYSNPAWED